MNIKQIAKKAGVSVATVSRVLNHPENVAEDTRRKIEDIIKEEEYTPNWFARGLNFNKTGTIGLIVPNILNPAPMAIAKGIEDVSHRKGYTTFMCNAENDAKKEIEYINRLIERRVDGIISIMAAAKSEDYRVIRDNKIPMVMIGENSTVTDVPNVRIECREAAQKAVNHLLDVGHRKNIMLCGESPAVENEKKKDGFFDAMRKRGLEAGEDSVVYVPNTIEGGYLGGKKILRNFCDTDAVFATSDMLAIGFIDAMRDKKKKVPDDIAVIGFDNIQFASLIEPKLTTVEKPLHKMGVIGARLLFDYIEGSEEELDAYREIILQPKLKIRKSCGHNERIGEMF